MNRAPAPLKLSVRPAWPAADPPGVNVSPRRGDAVLWYNYDADGKLDPRAVHCAKPVTSGQKWAANHWISLTPEELLTEVRPPTDPTADADAV